MGGNSPRPWQHDIVLQTLYSGRCGSEFALSFPYLLTQARSDVFFSLLFGGRIVASAGAFFDSSIALRIFGELFSVPGFHDCCEKYNWRPLSLYSDDARSWTATKFLAMRLRGPKSLGLFREREPGFEMEPEQIRAKRETIADLIEHKEFDRLHTHVRPFLADHVVPVYAFENNGCDAEEPRGESGQVSPPRPPATVAPILTSHFPESLRGVLGYLEQYDLLNNMAKAKRVAAIKHFSPLQAVRRRTEDVSQTSCEDYDYRELRELNHRFEAAVGSDPAMNAFHLNGPGIYGHYYNLVRSWIERDWHTVRQQAYGASTCILSTTWHDRAIFDFDKSSRAYYLSDARIDDSLRITQERFGNLDWNILIELVADSSWRQTIYQLRECSTNEDIQRASESILNLLANRLKDYSFHAGHGKVSVVARESREAAEWALTSVAVAGLFEWSVHAFHLLLGLEPTHALAEIAAPTVTKAWVSGATWLQRQRTNMQLRTAVVPQIYLGRHS